MDNYSEHILYDKVQSVRMPDCKSRDLRITVSETGRPFKKVVLKITDDDDPCILYNLNVTELDFTSLKAQQGLLVDFSNFAVHLVRLLEQCMNNAKGFLVVLEESLSETTLKIVQPIDLKNLCYISLCIAPGSDSEILRHMKSQILNLKVNRESDREECNILQQQVLELKKQLQEKDYELQRQENTFSEEQESLKKKAAAEISLLRDHLIMEKSTELDILEKKKEGLKSQVQEVSTELKNLKEKHRKLSEKYEESQRHMRELNNCIAGLENTRSQMREETADLRRRNLELEELYRKRELELDQCRAQNEKTEKELNKIRGRISSQDLLVRSSEEEQVKLRSTVAKLQEKYNARDELLCQVTTDLTKANLIIKERQKELEALHKQLQQLAVDNQEKQRQITNQALEMNLLKATIQKNDEKLQALLMKEKELTSEAVILKKSLAAKEEEHAKCGDVISYLHRSLKKVQLESAGAPSPILSSGAGAIFPPPTFASIRPSAPGALHAPSGAARGGAGTAVGATLAAAADAAEAVVAQDAGAPNKGPFYSTPLGMTGALGTTKRNSYPRTLSERLDQKEPSATRTRKSDGLMPKEALKPTQGTSQLKRLEAMRRKEKQPANGSLEKPVSVKAKGKDALEAKDGARRIQNKENKGAPAFKPSSYFQPNRITTDF